MRFTGDSKKALKYFLSKKLKALICIAALSEKELKLVKLGLASVQ